jgi:hypothetical protein
MPTEFWVVLWAESEAAIAGVPAMPVTRAAALKAVAQPGHRSAPQAGTAGLPGPASCLTTPDEEG